MAERPILFSGPMVRAILDGRKTVTRRVLKPQPFPAGYYEGEIDCLNLPGGARFSATAVGGAAICTDFISYPYYPGDRLWVREAWRSAAPLDDFSPSVIGEESMEIAPVRYEADGEAVNWLEWRGHDAGRLRAGMHMPRWASRITLEVTGVKVERLQEISEEEAMAEGIAEHPCIGPHRGPSATFWSAGDGKSEEGAALTPRLAFMNLWDSINGEREGASWEANPWVAAISFRRAG